MAVTDPFAPPGSITLIAPGMGAVVRQAADGVTGALSLLAGRGSIRLAWDRRDLEQARLRPWQRGLLDVLGLEPRSFASAPVSALGDDSLASAESGDESEGSYWLHAELVHLAAGLDRLTFLPLTGPATVTRGEHHALAPLITRHLNDSSLRLLTGVDERWFLHAPHAPDLETASPDAAAANELETVMPSGPDAGELRRVMTECQMLLHDHDVNEKRQRRGLPAINALWPWGGGVRSLHSARTMPRMVSDDAYVRGICRMHALEAEAAPESGADLIDRLDGTRPVIAVVSTDDSRNLEGNWIEPSIAALRAGRLECVDLILDEWHIRATRGMLRRFWRKPLLPPAWPKSI